MSVGIDLGTSSSLIALHKGDEGVKVLQNERGLTVTPSYVSYAHPEVVVGSVAKYEAVKNIDKVVYGVKRIIGKTFDDPTVQEDIKTWSFKVIEQNNMPFIKVDHKGKDLELKPQEVSAEVLKYLKKIAEEQLKEKEINTVVITVPAHFGPSQMAATAEAARLAGIKNYQLQKEPIAAALAYSEYRMKEGDHKILIYDFGGGTFDVSVVELRGKIIELIGTSGDSHLGGEDLTNVMFEYFYEKYKEKRGGEEGNEISKVHLRKACESAKIELSETDETTVECSVLESNGIDGNINKLQFEKLIKKYIDKTVAIVENLLKYKNIKKEDIGAIILAGGSSRIPLVKLSLENTFKDVPVFKVINPDEAIVHGAAFYANLYGKTDENLPQIIDKLEENDHPNLSVSIPGHVRKLSNPSPMFNSRERKENKNCMAIGIDLGTSTSLACYVKDGKAYNIPDVTGNNEISSCVLYESEDKKIIGLAAKSKAINNYKSFIYDIKRIIGRKYSDKIVESLIKDLNYDVRQDNSGNLIVKFTEKDPPFDKTPEQISADILSHLKENIERNVNGQKYKVVLTVPAHFTDSQRRATQTAADLAGLEVLQLINEPTAAAIAYGLTNNFDDKENVIVVYDFGGGTFDVSIIKIKGKNIELLGSNGDDHLGGSDITERIYDYFLKKYKEASGLESINAKASHHLRKSCESAKIELSEAEEVEVGWSGLENYGVDNTLTRSKFNELTKDLFDRTIGILDETMKTNGISKESINEIVLVGGSSKIPCVITMISNFLPGVKISKAINPIEAVSQGAAILADDLLKNGENAQIIETSYLYPPSEPSIVNTPQLNPQLNPPSQSFLPVVQQPPSIPDIISSNSSLTSSSQSTSIPPPPPPPPPPSQLPLPQQQLQQQQHRSVAESFVIKEKLSHSYGVLVTDSQTNQRRIDIILKKGTVIPCSEKKPYVTAPNYDKTKISIYEGEDIEIKQENFLHNFIFSGITKTPEGSNIEVEFSINKDGCLIVKGIDLSDPSHSKEVKVTIRNK